MSEYVAAYDIFITQEKMPLCVKGFCKHSGECDCVVINEDLSEDAKREAVEHEVKHFRRRDLESDKNVEVLETP